MKQTTSCRLARFAICAFALAGFFIPAGAPVAGTQPLGRPESGKADSGALAWDAELKEHGTMPGERYAKFSFWFTNTSSQDVVIRSAKSSCLCTAAQLPEQPWTIAAGRCGAIDVTMDLLGKGGVVTKAVVVDSTAGRKTLLAQARVTPPRAQELEAASGPRMDVWERTRNRETALADRQAVFKRQECASCHADLAKGKTDGAELYAAVCASCHDSTQRASVVPDLRALRHSTGPDHWRKWISQGRVGSMMPAFARSEGGPLEYLQIEALVDFLAKTIPSRPRTEERFDAKAHAEAMSAFPFPSSKEP